MADRPRQREKNVTGHAGPLRRRGQGLNSSSQSSGPRFGGTRGGGSMLLMLILALVFGGGSGLSGLLGGSGSSSQTTNTQTSSLYQTISSTGAGWTDASAATPMLNTKVVEGSREKRTKIRGNGKDTVTILVYMCGADLESRGGMATRDLQEMLQAKTGDQINLLVYTGGSSRWRNNTVSSQVNQVYQIKDGQLARLVDNAGTSAMTDPATLTSFIRYGKENFEADRYELILWDHGQGSLNGYGHDEKYARQGPMTLSGLNSALRDGGVSFDFIGFDACLMATVETANVATKYADYLIASEETEPGYGWYYTDWITKLSQNTSMPTIEMGQNIVDDFVTFCEKNTRGQSATLSVVDLAEFSHTVPSKLKDFAKNMNTKLENKQYQEISNALSRSRRFATTSRIDQVDVVNLTDYIDSQQGKELAQVIKSCVKYNRTSRDMSNSYGLSIYFPYYTANKVDAMASINKDTEMDEDYTRCIQSFARMATGGQVSYGGSGYGQQSLYDLLGLGSTTQPVQQGNPTDLLNLFLGGNTNSISGLSGTNFLTNRTISDEDVVSYINENRLEQEDLVWKQKGQNYVMSLSEDKWKLVNQLDLKALYDDGSGYIDLGLDNIFELDDEGNLVADTQRTWLAVNNQVVAYYHDKTVDDGDHYVINGHIPALLNDERVNLLVQFTDENPKGEIIGASVVYDQEDMQLVAKNIVEIEEGDTIDFICEYYSYDGQYQDDFMLGDRITVDGDLTISDLILDESTLKLTYQFIDIYNQTHYSEVITLK